MNDRRALSAQQFGTKIATQKVTGCDERRTPNPVHDRATASCVTTYAHSAALWKMTSDPAATSLVFVDVPRSPDEIVISLIEQHVRLCDGVHLSAWAS